MLARPVVPRPRDAAQRVQQGGFTLTELIIIMILVGILGVSVMPKLQATISLRDDSWRDGLVTAMRYAQKTAVSHRRLVCVTVADTTVTLTIAEANPATACNLSLTGPRGTGAFATSDNPSMLTTVSPAGVLFFQPDGRVTSDGAGTMASNRTISLTGASSIVVRGETGHVE
jgi:MSHA pilin protein MshC